LETAKARALAFAKEKAKAAALRAVEKVIGKPRAHETAIVAKASGENVRHQLVRSEPRAPTGAARRKTHNSRNAQEGIVVASSAKFSSDPASGLRGFLRDPTGVIDESASFQLRCKQFSKDGFTKYKVVVIVSGKTRLWKLNQIIAECFDAGEGEFTYEAKQGTTVLGSRFIVSRPQCDKAIICSSSSAAHVGSPSDFLDDRNFSVAQLFRGKSTREALIQDAADAAQQVSFCSPCLANEVHMSLDGIMLDRYDSQKLFDKKRRHNNGSKPLPRIVRSSFMSVAEIEAKNVLMQGAREGPDFLLRIATPMSALHEASRRSQRKPLFRKDGRDYDLHDLCYVSGDEESETDEEAPEPDEDSPQQQV
jgi:hypothetical protein